MPNIELANKMIDALGGTGAVAELFDKHDSAVSRWRNRGIPSSYMLLIRYKRPKVYKQVMGEIRKELK